MSNPGVITLVKTELGAMANFLVEDNLGEAIHFHYRNIRMDLTIREFLQIADACDETIYRLVSAENFRIDDFDTRFLLRHTRELMDLKSVERQKVSANNLYYIGRICFIPFRRKLRRKSAKKFATLPVDNDNAEPVLFNDDNIIMDGLQATAKNYLEHPDGEIMVKRMYFENGRHTPPVHPWLRWLFRWDRERIKSVLVKIARKLRF